MQPPGRVPPSVDLQFPTRPVASHLDYSPATHPRKLDPSADAQRIIDGLVNQGGSGGIPERVAYDGGFRVGGDKHYHAADVANAVNATAQHYVDLSERAAQAGDTKLSQHYRSLAADIGKAQVTYAKTTKAYWNGSQTTPRDVVSNADQGERPIGQDGQPLRSSKQAVGK